MHTLFFFVVALALLIGVHEYGHFLTARRLGIRVEKFSIGFGPALFSWRSRDGEVEYVVAAIPLGGYVKMLGETPGDRAVVEALDARQRARAFDAQPVWKRAAVASAGPLANFAFAVVVYMLIGWIGQEVLPPQLGYVEPGGAAARAGLKPGDRIVRVDGVRIPSWHALELALKDRVGGEARLTVERGGAAFARRVRVPAGRRDALLVDVAAERLGMGPATEVVIDEVRPDGPAARAGVRPGDRVAAVDGRPVRLPGTLIRAVQRSAGRALRLTLRRPGGAVRTVAVVPRSDAEIGGKGRIGVRLSVRPLAQRVRYRMGPLEGVAYGFSQTWSVTLLTCRVLGKMVTAAISPQNLGGPIAIARMAGESASMGLVPFLAFLALISVNLGVLNLLPVPVLDGGHLLYLSLEKLRGRPLSERMMERTQYVGVVLIGALMLFALYNDLARWLGGR